MNPKSPITKNKASKSPKEDFSYEPRQYMHAVFNYVDPATANINIPIDESGEYAGGVEITLVKFCFCCCKYTIFLTISCHYFTQF